MNALEERCGLRERTALVIGGAGGLGRACAAELASAGARVHVADRDAEAIDELRAQLVGTPYAVSATHMDARDDAARSAVFQEVEQTLGALDVLVNVVGGAFHQPFRESTPRGWDALIDANFRWLLGSSQLAIDAMRPGGGSIINITSIEAHRAAPGFAVYAAMKAAVTSLTRTLAVELGPDGIRVNAIAPDFVPTPNMAGVVPTDTGSDAETDRIAIPLGRRGNYADVGGCALFLASDLSRYVTGTVLHPDGGVNAARGWFNWPGAGWRNLPPADVVRRASESP
jgi:NAD(P)-dependent dehydrogenase (short-subunit alcohol dehydrogenase family)